MILGIDTEHRHGLRAIDDPSLEDNGNGTAAIYGHDCDGNYVKVYINGWRQAEVVAGDLLIWLAGRQGQ